MRVIKPAADEPANAAECRLICEMLCLERGARAYATVAVEGGAHLTRLAEPHDPWPTVTLPPRTEEGAAITVRYAPSVGVVFYTTAAGDSVADLVTRVSAALARAGDAHLQAGRAAAASPATVLRHKNRAEGTAIATGPRKCYKKPMSSGKPVPARLVMWTPPEQNCDLPAHWSMRAAFTWVFMPATAGIAAMSCGFQEMCAVNASVAGLFFDAARVSGCADASDIQILSSECFARAPLPRCLRARQLDAQAAWALGVRAGTLVVMPRESGAIIVAPSDGAGAPSRLVYVGDHANLADCGLWCVWPPDLRAKELPFEAWDPSKAAQRDGAPPGVYQCLVCDAPLHGTAVALRDTRVTDHSLHGDWYISAPRFARLLEDGEYLLLCPFCWNSLDFQCVSRHMRAVAAHVIIPTTAVAAAAACPGYETLAILLDSTVVPLEGAAGAYVVTLSADGPGAGESLILTGECLGEYPTITQPAIAGANLGVISGLRVAALQRAEPR